MEREGFVFGEFSCTVEAQGVVLRARCSGTAPGTAATSVLGQPSYAREGFADPSGMTLPFPPNFLVEISRLNLRKEKNVTSLLSASPPLPLVANRSAPLFYRSL